ncbi:MAG: triphosphoribosyl-dephospho-CoA synthase [Burkholderiaceae bacterium]|nr:triphosphoribosyl-dephospho-CoA synthase [Burkholderiaceae bacterium]
MSALLLLDNTPSTDLARRLADAAQAALTDEATLTPKPGLVDLRGNGAHDDLNWLLMCHSARTLQPYFEAMAQAGVQLREPQALRERIGALGRDAERAMMRATGGVNTHRGAIWALGLLVTAAAQHGAAGSAQAQEVVARAGALARLHDPHMPAVTGNKGALACLRHGVGGARAQAMQGFPHVIEVALPMLRASRSGGATEDQARLNALLAVMAQLDDTCLLARGGRQALAATQQGARRVLAAGGVATAGGRRALRRLDEDLLARRLSPGGAADLLAAALLLERIAHLNANLNFNAEHEHGTTAV